jgi:hypothetical protein
MAEGGNMWLEVQINKKNGKNKEETYLGPKQHVWHRLGSLLLSQPLQDLLMLLKHNYNLKINI